MQNATLAAEAAPKKNPTLRAIFDAYLAAKENPRAIRRCKHPATLRTNLLVPMKLWGHLTIKEFRKDAIPGTTRTGSKARVAAAVDEWRVGAPGVKPLTLATCRKRVTIMRAAFRFAVSEEMIKRNHEPVFELPPNGAPRERFVDPAIELPKLLRAADAIRTPDHIRTAMLILFITGQRRGALLDLKWEHVDFEKRIIRFRDTEAAADRSKKRRVDQPMSDDLLEIMLAAKERATCDFVIEWNGKQCKTIYPAMKRLFTRAGMPDLRIHDLRRSSATYVYNELEGDLTSAARHIGDTEKMAESVYVQKDIAKNLKGIEAVSAVLEQARSAA